MNIIIKGFIIGIGKIIPGVSGAMLAITLGEYEKIICAIASMKHKTIENTKYLSKIGIGIILAIILTSKIIVKCLNTYYFPTMLLFIGMITGGIPNMLKKINPKTKDILIAIVILTITYIIIKNIIPPTNCEIKPNFVKLIGIGALDALSSIIPGISGTAILMMLGYYETILQTFATITNISIIIKNMIILIPFIIGFILGTITISKIIYIIIKKHKNILNIIIAIFMIITLTIILKETLKTATSIKEIIIGTILGIIGITISIKLEQKEQKNNKLLYSNINNTHAHIIK